MVLILSVPAIFTPQLGVFRDRAETCAAERQRALRGRAVIVTRRGRSGGGTSRQEDLASVIARKQRQITTAGLVPVGLSRLWYRPVTQVQPPGRSHA
jgi:hypothetical protein